MKSNSVLIEAIFIENPSPQEYVKKVKRALKQMRLIETAKSIFKKLIKILAPRTKEEWFSNDFYYSYSNKVYIVDNFNGKQCEQLLVEIEPDIIVLGGSRIIRKNIIKIPKIGILNVHPGLLPKYRGVDVIPWPIYNEDDIGVTVHFVDKGVDTGGIVMQKVINVEEDDTIDSLRKNAQIVTGELMTKTILKIIESGHIQVIPQSKQDGKQYYKMPKRLLRETERKLRK